MDEASVDEIVKRLTDMNFEFSVVEKLDKGLGLSIKRDDEAIVVSQPTYVDFIEQEFKDDLVNTDRTIYTPMVDWLEESKPSEELFDTTKYRSLLGCLSHLGRMTRPDILQATFHLAQFAQKPCHRHWKGLSRIVHYLSATKHKGIRFSMNDNITAQNLAQGEATLNRMKHIDALSKHLS